MNQQQNVNPQPPPPKKPKTNISYIGDSTIKKSLKELDVLFPSTFSLL